MKQFKILESFPIEQQDAAALAALDLESPDQTVHVPRKLIERFQAIAATLADTIAPVAPSASLKQRLMSRIADYQALGPIADVRRDESPWRPSGFSGVEIRTLFQDAAGKSTVLLRMQPGATLPSHHHFEDEQCLVLEGDIRWRDVVYEQGDFVVMGKDSDHPEICTVHGNTLLLIAGRNEYAETAVGKSS